MIWSSIIQFTDFGAVGRSPEAFQIALLPTLKTRLSIRGKAVNIRAERERERGEKEERECSRCGLCLCLRGAAIASGYGAMRQCAEVARGRLDVSRSDPGSRRTLLAPVSRNRLFR